MAKFVLKPWSHTGTKKIKVRYLADDAYKSDKKRISVTVHKK